MKSSKNDLTQDILAPTAQTYRSRTRANSADAVDVNRSPHGRNKRRRHGRLRGREPGLCAPVGARVLRHRAPDPLNSLIITAHIGNIGDVCRPTPVPFVSPVWRLLARAHIVASVAAPHRTAAAYRRNSVARPKRARALIISSNPLPN
uniref:Uncharacterized protein n=1 Tax=Plectus sambesii TaxID=2011161 RepID=A0A914UM50_9BILA